MKIPAQPMTAFACRAYTLIELLSVLAIFIILLSIAVASSVHWGRAARMRGSVQKAKASLEQARQWAVTHGVPTDFVFTNSVFRDDVNTNIIRGCYAITNFTQGLIGTTNYLAKGIVWSNCPEWPESAGVIRFLADGSLDAATNRQLVLFEPNKGANALMTTLTIYRVTGRAKVEE